MCSKGLNRYSQTVTASGLGEGESSGLNIASLLKAFAELILFKFERRQAVPLMVRTKLFKDHFPLASRYGLYLNRKEINSMLGGLIISLLKRIITRGPETIRLKEKSDLPKRGIRIHITGNIGLPKGVINSYGNGVAIVPLRGSATANKFSFRCYSTDRALNVTTKQNYLSEFSKKLPKKDPLRMKVSSILEDFNFLKKVYNELKSEPHQMTGGLNTTFKKSDKDLKKLAQELKSEKFQFRPGDRIQVSKDSGGYSFFTITPIEDQIILKGMKKILEIIFDHNLANESHGFRPNRNYHTALKHLKTNFEPCT